MPDTFLDFPGLSLKMISKLCIFLSPVTHGNVYTHVPEMKEVQDHATLQISSNTRPSKPSRPRIRKEEAKDTNDAFFDRHSDSVLYLCNKVLVLNLHAFILPP